MLNSEIKMSAVCLLESIFNQFMQHFWLEGFFLSGFYLAQTDLHTGDVKEAKKKVKHQVIRNHFKGHYTIFDDVLLIYSKTCRIFYFL